MHAYQEYILHTGMYFSICKHLNISFTHCAVVDNDAYEEEEELVPLVPPLPLMIGSVSSHNDDKVANAGVAADETMTAANVANAAVKAAEKAAKAANQSSGDATGDQAAKRNALLAANRAERAKEALASQKVISAVALIEKSITANAAQPMNIDGK